MEQIDSNIKKAAKWSSISELISKLVNPITNMILARILAPEAYGVVATLTMIITFAEIFTDAGFQKYLIQHEFSDDEDREHSTNVAFWTNLTMSLMLWLIIIIFSSQIAEIVGNPGGGDGISIASVSKVRMIGICVPIFITVPLALWLENYWALVIATVVRNSIDAIMLTYFSKWKPKFLYSFRKIKEMLSFTIWSILESVLVWLTNYIELIYF